MSKRSTPRLQVWGEYDTADAEDSLQVWRARLELIQTVARVFPPFLQKLSTDVYPLFDRLANEGTLMQGGYDFEKWLWSDNPRLKISDVLAPDLTGALRHWAVLFNAESDWVIKGALRTLRGWRVRAEWRKALRWDTLHGRNGVAVVGKPFEFSFDGWDFQTITLEQYKKDLQKSLKRKLAEYERETRELAESKGLIRARRTFSPLNLEWFVRFQFAGLSFKEIADLNVSITGKGDESTVRKGVHTAADLIAWDQLRDSR